jgi:hypothetical protein
MSLLKGTAFSAARKKTELKNEIAYEYIPIDRPSIICRKGVYLVNDRYAVKQHWT